MFQIQFSHSFVDIEVLFDDELEVMSNEDEKDDEGEFVNVWFLFFCEGLSISDSMDDKESLSLFSCIGLRMSLTEPSTLLFCEEKPSCWSSFSDKEMLSGSL